MLCCKWRYSHVIIYQLVGHIISNSKSDHENFISSSHLSRWWGVGLSLVHWTQELQSRIIIAAQQQHPPACLPSLLLQPKQKSSIFKGSSLRFPQKPFIKQEYYIPCCQQFERILVYTITKEKLINQKWKSLQIPPSFYGTSKHFNYLNFPC